MREIVARITDNFPFTKIGPKLHTSASHALEKEGMHPLLKKALDKAEL